MVIRINKKRLSSQSSLCVFIAGLILLPIYIDLMGTLSRLIGFNTTGTTYIYYGALWFFLLRAIPGILRSITKKTLLGISVFFLIVVVLFVLYPGGRRYLKFPSLMDMILFSPSTILSVVPYILIGLAVENIEQLRKNLHFVARVGVLCGAISYIVAIVSGYELYYDDMNNAYALCIAVCILITDYRKKDAYFLVLGCLSMLLAGTRGPLVCVLVATGLRILLHKENGLKKTIKIGVAVLAVILLQGDLLIGLVNMISDGFASIGVTELRIIDYFRSGMLTNSSGRNTISSMIAEKIMEKPFLGYGPGGDRIALATTSYAHNLGLEIWASYGIFIGTMLLGWLGYWFAKAIFGKDKSLCAIATALFSSVVVKLFFSSSYLYSKEMFLLLGICIAGCTALKKKADVKVDMDG